MGYKETEITETLDCDDPNFGRPWFFYGNGTFLYNSKAGAAAANSNGTLPIGVAGSYARFGQWGDYLYCMDNTKLHSFLLSNPAQPTRPQSQHIGRNIETIFP